MSGISTQPNSYNRTVSNSLSDEKGPKHWIHLVIWIIYLYLIHLFSRLCMKFIFLMIYDLSKVHQTERESVKIFYTFKNVL